MGVHSGGMAGVCAAMLCVWAVPAPADDKKPEPRPVPATAPGAPASPTKPAPAKPDAPATPPTPAADEIVLPGASPDAEGAPATKKPDAPAGSAGEFVIPDNPRFPADKIVKAKVERKQNGALLIDAKYTVTGAGSKDDPYIVPWDLIVSAQDTYRPRKGQTKLPQRVVMLDGKHVIVSGYIAFPITAATPKEALVMLNQWDGCCIGTPPTAYDAIEVHLAEPAKAAQRMAVHGTMRGVFKVDPYEDSGWLLGLYIIEEATLTTDQ